MSNFYRKILVILYECQNLAVLGSFLENREFLKSAQNSQILTFININITFHQHSFNIKTNSFLHMPPLRTQLRIRKWLTLSGLHEGAISMIMECSGNQHKFDRKFHTIISMHLEKNAISHLSNRSPPPRFFLPIISPLSFTHSLSLSLSDVNISGYFLIR